MSDVMTGKLDEQRAAGEEPQSTPQPEQVKVSREVQLKVAEQEIIAEQLAKLEEDKDGAARLRPLRKKEKVGETVPPLLKIFIEAFAAKGHLLVPTAPKHALTDIDITAAYRRTIISPRNFPDQMMAYNFDGSFKHPKTHPEGLRERARIVEALRVFFPSLVPLQMKSKDGERERRVECKRVYVNPLKVKKGSLVVSRTVQTVDGPRRDVMHYTTLHDLKRGNHRVLNSGSEQKMLANLRDSIQENITFLQRWKHTSTKEKTVVEDEIIELQQELGAAIDINKAQASQKLGAVGDFRKGAQRRLNPGACSAQLVAGYNRLRARTQKLYAITSNVQQDQEIVKTLIEELEAIFDSVSAHFEDLLRVDYFKPYGKLEDPDDYLLKHALETNANIYDPNEGNGIAVRLEKLRKHQATPAPFSGWANAIMSNLDKLKLLNKEIILRPINGEALSEHHGKIRKLATRAHLAFRYQKLHGELMKLLDELLDNIFEMQSADMRVRVEQLLKDFNPHAFGVDFEYHSDIRFQIDTFAQITGQLNELIEVIKQREGEPLPDNETGLQEAREVYKDKIYAKIKGIDFEYAQEVLTVNGLI